jgi:nucleotide-binding universal stress UspA family protein
VKIVLAIDSSAASEVAVAEVAQRPWPDGSLVDVVSAVDSYSTWSAPGLSDALTGSAGKLVTEVAARLETSGLTCTSHVLTGRPKAAVVDYAAQSSADLVVVGSHEDSNTVRFLLGSVAKAVVQHAPCSVEIVRPRAGTGAMKILLATDGSDSSQNAASSIASRPWPQGSEVRVLSVVELSAAWFREPAPAYLEPEAIEDLRAKAMKHAQDAAASAEKILAGSAVATSTTVAIPSAATKEVIVTQAAEWGADLLVLGSHGLRETARFLLGSVSEPVALHAPCSVEIIRPRGHFIA